MYDFDYVRVRTVAEAVAALAGEDAYPLAGGQSFVPALKQRLARPARVVDVSGVAEMIGVREEAGAIAIGAATTHAAVAADPVVTRAIPALAALAGRIGDPQVRNRGTLGGSIAHDDPAACWPAALLGLGATVITSAREIAAEEFFVGFFETALAKGEVVTAVRFPVPVRAAYRKFVQPASRFAMAGAFAALTEAGPRVAITGASSSGAFRWTEAEAALAADWSEAAIAPLALDPEGMLGDIHATPDYRAHLVKVMTKRAVAAAA